MGDDFRDSLTDTTAPLGALAIGSSIAGTIESFGDKDLFAVSLVAGSTYTFNLKSSAASGLDDPFLRLLDSTGAGIAQNDDFGGGLNSQITYTATKTGKFYLEAKDYLFGDGGYTLSAKGPGTPGPTDDFRDSLTDTTAPLGSLAVDGSTRGAIEAGGDRDIFRISLTEGHTYTFDLKATASGRLGDPFLRLLDSSGVRIAANNDFGGGKNSEITFTATQTGNFYLEARGADASHTGAYVVSASDDTTVPTDGEFDIVIDFSGNARYEAAFEQAAARWEEVIIGDLPDFNSSQFGAIDDLLIDASAVFIDGQGSVLGRAGPDLFRSGSLLPAHGVMEFDSADLSSMESNGTLVDVIMHEMGHVLGLGTLWSQKGLKSGDLNYIGQNALDEYRTLTGNPNATSIPLESTGGQGTRGAHWSEAVFGSELMTGFASGGMELSRMTIGALEDFGYRVDYGAADAYSLPNRIAALQGAEQDLLIL